MIFSKKCLAAACLLGAGTLMSIQDVQSFTPALLSQNLHSRTTGATIATPKFETPKFPSYKKSQLFGKMWDGLEIEEGENIHWYLINCVAGLELDLLAQCREMCKDYPKTDVVRFAVPTMREARSHGKRNVVEDIVLYPGYVFAKIRLCEAVYEEVSALATCRTWMGTQRRQGHKRLPSVPLPLTEDEIASFKGLEEEMEKNAETTTEELLKQYEGFEVESMVKILEGKHAGEDGIVKRLKGGKISVRLYTYGSQFDEWLRPDQIRPLTELEVMRGLSGQETPVRQDDFDQSIGRPTQARRKPDSDDSSYSKRNMRRDLMGSVKGYRAPRNRQQDRQARGKTGRDTWADRQQLQREDENWQQYKKRQTDEEMNKNAYDVDSQWGRATQQNRRKKQDRFANADDEDWSQFTSTASDDSASADNKSSGEDDFFNDLMSELSTTLEEDTDKPKQSKKASSKSQAEDDFFSSLMSELSSETDDSSDYGAKDKAPAEASSEEDFFATLEKEMTLASGGSTEPSPSKAKSTKKKESKPVTAEDDFFAQLESSLSANLDDIDISEDEAPLLEDIAHTPEPATKKKTTKKSSPAPAPASSNAGSDADLSKLTVPVLKSMLKEKGLKVSGKKSELIDRLMTN